MHVLLSYLSTNFSQLKDHWMKHSILKDKGKRGSDRPFTRELGGRLEIIDWSTKETVWTMPMNSPTGTYRLSSDLLMVNSLRQGAINVISLSRKATISTLSNPAFNKPHSLVKTNSGFLVSSTGVDAIVEVDSYGRTLYSIFLTQHGYELDQTGLKRSLDTTADHRGVEYPSLHQTTHVNYAQYLDLKETKIVATLFHPGELVVIDKKSKEIHVVLNGLNNPHNLKSAGEKKLLSNTSSNTILVLDKNLKVVDQLGENLGMSWVQDASYCDARNTILVADADNHRVLELNWKGVIVDEYVFSVENRIYEACKF